MSKDNFFQKIINLLIGGMRTLRSETAARQNGSMMGKLFQMVEDTDEDEIACDEVYRLLDQYVELEARGEDVADLLPLVKRHLDRCRDCFEEYEALMRIIHVNP